MKTNHKLLFSLAFVPLAIWLGTSIIRSAIAFDLFIFDGAMKFNYNIETQVLLAKINAFIDTSVYSDILYGISFLSFFVITFKLNDKFKKQGWLYMSVLLFFIFSPIELFLIYHDYLMAVTTGMENYHTTIFNIEFSSIKELFGFRFFNPVLKTLMPLSFLSNLFVVFFYFWTPLRKDEEHPDT